jgi:hypothetical protein
MLFPFLLQKLVVIGIVVVTVFQCTAITRNLGVHVVQER